jgi:hypothetical protein
MRARPLPSDFWGERVLVCRIGSYIFVEKVDSSFSEEKEAKRLYFWGWFGGRLKLRCFT